MCHHMNDANKNFIKRRKDNKLCLKCGKPLDRDGVHCIECTIKNNAHTKEIRKWYQDNHICPRCRINSLYGNEKNCTECSVKSYESMIRNRNKDKYNKNHAEWSKRTHHEMIEKGICTRCRKRSADSGYKTCSICRCRETIKKRERNWKKSRSERVDKGLCYFCDNKIKPGYKVCEKHYQSNVENSRSEKAKAAREKLKEGVLY